jgi:Zn-dependent peptidase ImmA (M78 family)
MNIADIALGVIGPRLTLPIPVEEIVLSQNIQLVAYEFGEEISGVLIIDHDKATIGYNKNEHRVRNRFTIAHELGHFELHKQQDLFVDKGFKVMFRGAETEQWNKQQERDANQFAACLLMPEDLLRAEASKLDFDYTEEISIKTLAKIFDVSSVAMSIRLSALGLL